MMRYLNQRFGDYRLVRLLGSGGFADVYEGEHLYLPGRKAAIKILKDAFTTKQIEGLRKEALIVSALDHPHIVRLLGFSVEQGIPYLVMSYVPGGAVSARYPRGTSLPLPLIVSYIRQIAAALHYAHTQPRPVIHRDIKPGNFLLTQDGRVQVADFGIALMAQSSKSFTMQEVAGTWAYMAPEQFDGKAEAASDQYSLGIVVYQWLCGQLPFTGHGNLYLIPQQQKNQPPPPLHEQLPDLPPAIEEVVMKALAKNPAERFDSIQAFATALAEASRPAFLPAPGQYLGDYRLVRLLGSGGFADVYEAEHRHLGTRAAIKLLKGTLSAEQIERLRQEARTVMDLDHQHIIRVLGFSIEDGIPYLVMSYAPGGSLDMHHPAGNPLPLDTILTYTRQVASALQYAHDQQIIHRDIKPANFLLAKDGRVLVADFGTAVMAHTTQARTQQEIAGTWVYMAPEQFEGKAEAASDQYSLGIVVYQWLCGEPPFTGQENMYILPYQQMSVPPPPLSEKVPGLSPAIEKVVMKALAKEPAERFADVQAFAQALEQAAKKPAPGTTLLTYEHPGGYINAVSWSPDGTRLASGGLDATVRIWDALSGKQVLKLRGHAAVVLAVAWSPDGRWLASASWDKMVQVWEAASGKQVLTYQGHRSPVFAVAWSPTGRWVASAGGDETVQVWAAATGDILLTYHGHYGAVSTVAWSPDGERIASVDFEVHIWQAEGFPQSPT